MPHLIDNFVSCDGPETQAVLDLVTSSNSACDFNKIIPAPPDLKDGWRKWRTANWETKWDAHEAGGAMDEPGKLGFGFRTAWDAPFPIIRKLSDLFPKTNFQLGYRGEEEDYLHVFVYQRGQIVDRYECTLPEFCNRERGMGITTWAHVRRGRT